MNRTTRRFSSKLRARRHSRDFERALRTASPAMHQELIAAAAHQQHLI